MKLLLSVICVILFSSLWGQDKLRKELEVLKKEIRQSTYYDSAAVFAKGQKAIALAKRLKDPTEEATIYQFYGNFYYFSYDLDKAQSNYSKSIEIAQKSNNNKLINSTKIRLAFIKSDTDLLAAEREFQLLLKDAIKFNYTENTIEIYNGLGNVYDARQMKDEALKYYLKGLKLAEKAKKKYLNSMMLNNIGLIKFENGQVKEAEKDFTEALQIINGMNEDRLSLNLNNNLGLVNKRLKLYSKSIKYYHNTLLNAKKLGFPLGRGVAFLNLSDSYLNYNNFALANIYADSALQILTSFKQWDYVSMAYLIKASINRKLTNFPKAINYTDSVFNLTKLHPSSTAIMNAHDELSRIYADLHNYKSALFHSDRFHEMSDSISEVANKDQFAQLQVIYGKEKVETELENEKNKNSLLFKENEIKQTKIRAIILISLFALIITAGLFYIRQVRLTRKNQQKFTQKLIENIDAERSRIAKDLHDDIGQSLSVIKSKLNLLNTGRINDVIGLDTEVGDVINHTRSISHFLHPSIIQKLGLERSLVSLTEKTQDNTDLVCSLSVKCSLDALSLEIQTQVYRILQECINNTIKHAEATALKISIKENNKEIIVKYQDNGKGLEENTKKIEGIGLLTMRERAATISGKIVLVPTKGKGFKLTLSFIKPI